MELLLIRDLYGDLRRDLQDLQHPGQQMDLTHRGSRRRVHNRHHLAGDELQSSLQ